MWLHPGTPRLAATGSSRDQRVAGDGAAPQPHRGRVRGRRARSTAVADDVGRRLRDHAARVVHHEGGRQGGASVTIPCPPPTPLPFTSLSGWAAAPNTASSKPTATLTATASAARPSHSPPVCQLPPPPPPSPFSPDPPPPSPCAAATPSSPPSNQNHPSRKCARASSFELGEVAPPRARGCCFDTV